MSHRLESKILFGGLIIGSVSVAVGAYLEKNGAFPTLFGILALAICGMLLLEPKE